MEICKPRSLALRRRPPVELILAAARRQRRRRVEELVVAVQLLRNGLDARRHPHVEVWATRDGEELLGMSAPGCSGLHLHRCPVLEAENN